MNWVKKPYPDGDGFYWSYVLPIGEIGVEFADWVDADRSWTVTWWPIGGGGAGVSIGRAKSGRAGKALARLYVRRMADALNEALA